MPSCVVQIHTSPITAVKARFVAVVFALPPLWDWCSLAARLAWAQEVGGSNPSSQTRENRTTRMSAIELSLFEWAEVYDLLRPIIAQPSANAKLHFCTTLADGDYAYRFRAMNGIGARLTNKNGKLWVERTPGKFLFRHAHTSTPTDYNSPDLGLLDKEIERINKILEDFVLKRKIGVGGGIGFRGLDSRGNCCNCRSSTFIQHSAHKIVCDFCGKVYRRENIPTKEKGKTMQNVKDAFKSSNAALVRSVKAGGKQALGVKAQAALVDALRKTMGDHFPSSFYETPAGRAVIDASCCYLVRFLADSFPDMPGADTVRDLSEHAMTGVAARSFGPLMEAAQGVFQSVSAEAKKAGLLKSE